MPHPISAEIHLAAHRSRLAPAGRHRARFPEAAASGPEIPEPQGGRKPRSTIAAGLAALLPATPARRLRAWAPRFLLWLRAVPLP